MKTKEKINKQIRELDYELKRLTQLKKQLKQDIRDLDEKNFMEKIKRK